MAKPRSSSKNRPKAVEKKNAQAGAPAGQNGDKKVRVTIEVDSQFLRLLRANIEMSRPLRGWLFNNDDAGDITPPQVLGLLVYMEARGGTVEQIAASTPFMWRPNVEVIHDERRVYQGGKQISGPVLEPVAAKLPLNGGEDYTSPG